MAKYAFPWIICVGVENMTSRPAGFFITGTDTSVGKTCVSAALMHILRKSGLRVAGIKPVASGCVATAAGLRNEDALALQRQSSIDLPYELINPYAFAPAIAPHLAAQDAGVAISIQHLLDIYRIIVPQVDCAIVEGAGGWLVPLGPDSSLADLAVALQLPVIMVVDIRLGCINHALLTARAIAADGLLLAGWVANHARAGYERSTDNISSIAARLTCPLLGTIPHQDSFTSASLSDYLRMP